MTGKGVCADVISLRILRGGDDLGFMHVVLKYNHQGPPKEQREVPHTQRREAERDGATSHARQPPPEGAQRELPERALPADTSMISALWSF